MAKLAALAPMLLTPKERAFLLGARGKLRDVAGALPAFDAVLLEGAERRIAGLAARGEPGPMDGLAGPPEDYLRRLAAKGVSPSALDEYALCPFRFFAKKILDLEDPDEKTNVASAHPLRAASLRETLLLWVARVFRPEATAGPASMSRDECEALKALGYLSGDQACPER